MSDEYQFTNDWFSWAPGVWEQLIPTLPERRSILEIGSFEGRSTVWLLEHMLDDGGRIDCIDTWGGGEEHTDVDMVAVERRFDRNVSAAREKTHFKRQVRKMRGTSREQMPTLMVSRLSNYDFIYIDGSHVARDVLTDACMAWTMLKPGGIMVFDDYVWGDPRDILHRPKVAIDAFVNIFAEELDIVFTGYQLGVRKK